MRVSDGRPGLMDVVSSVFHEGVDDLGASHHMDE